MIDKFDSKKTSIITISQQNFLPPKINNLGNQENFLKIAKSYKKAVQNNYDAIIYPELALTSYMVRDIFLNKDFISICLKLNERLITQTKETILFLPTITKGSDNKIYNSIISARNGQIIDIYNKQYLPNYSIFNESRYFAEGNKPSIININNIKIGLMICEDIWYDNIYEYYIHNNVDICLVSNASPFNKLKQRLRENIIYDKQRKYKDDFIPIIYCNLISSVEGIIFDGRSIISDKKDIIYKGKFLKEEDINISIKRQENNNLIIKVINKSIERTCKKNNKNIASNKNQKNNYFININPEENIKKYEEIDKAILFATQNYLSNNNFTKTVWACRVE
ncbi:MAG TPA: nitrilase-related carbon-nitrogen hydrolase [Candidatus Megaira endosymbiont of Hartmannula sinica]|nr:nitrilase-related carbon-nitrogen hydrolase [Candidatus Megaera endosymbiont of Hartmannula sinica]